MRHYFYLSGKGPRRIYLWVAVGAAALCGCADSRRAIVAGRWRIDSGSVQSTEIGKYLHDPQTSVGMIRALAGISYNFADDGTCSVTSQVAGATRPGTWSVDGANIKVHFQGETPDEANTKYVLVAGPRIRVFYSGDAVLAMELIKQAQ